MDAKGDKDKQDSANLDVNVTNEVGSEGGSPGDVEVGEDAGPGVGAEAAETWEPRERDRTEVVRDETGQGRRSP
jgi:hypothetical protein